MKKVKTIVELLERIAAIHKELLLIVLGSAISSIVFLEKLVILLKG